MSALFPDEQYGVDLARDLLAEQPAPTPDGLRTKGLLDTIARLDVLCEKHQRVVDAARLATTSVRDLIQQSRGVDGLHRNGDIATWDELLRDGRYEEWLRDFNALEDAVQAMPKVAVVPPPPRRRVVLELKVGADSVRDLASALWSMSQTVDCEWKDESVSPNGCMGGPTSGYHYTASVDPSVTHESYFAAIAEWKKKREAIKAVDGAAS